MNKQEYIQSLIQTAQETIWRNELAAKYNEQFGEGKDKEEKAKATAQAIEKDLQYIAFLQDQCESVE